MDDLDFTKPRPEWDGRDRRSSARNDPAADAFHRSLREVHKRIDEHLGKATENAVTIALLQDDVTGIHKRLDAINSTLQDLKEIKMQAQGGIRLLVALSALVAAGAGAWSFMANEVFGWLKK